jgi:Amt family ammonium transporter
LKLETQPTMANASAVPLGYQQGPPASPVWLNKGDNAWQMISATLVGMQGMPGLVILYAGLVKKKWALNSAFMALFAFAAVMPCWVLWAYKMSFGHKLLPFWGKAGLAVSQDFLIPQAVLPSTGIKNNTAVPLLYPTATMVFFQYAFAAVTVILLAGSVLARMSIKAWMVFVPLWITFSYSVGAYSVWGGGFLFQWGVMDYSGGYVVHLASGAAGFTAAYWVSTG